MRAYQAVPNQSSHSVFNSLLYGEPVEYVVHVVSNHNRANKMQQSRGRGPSILSEGWAGTLPSLVYTTPCLYDF